MRVWLLVAEWTRPSRRRTDIPQPLEHPSHQLDVLEAVAAHALVQHPVGDGPWVDPGVATQEHVDVAEGEGAHVREVDAFEEIEIWGVPAPPRSVSTPIRSR